MHSEINRNGSVSAQRLLLFGTWKTVFLLLGCLGILLPVMWWIS